MSAYKIFNSLLHFPNKFFYKVYNIDKNLYKDFEIYGHKKESINNEKKIIIENINNFIEKSLNLEKIREDSILNNTKEYSIILNSYFPKEILNLIKKFFSSEEEIQKVSSMLNQKLELRNVLLLYNFYNPNVSKDEGAKMYHRDSDSLQDQIKHLLLINSISESNGMFFFIPKNIISENVRIKIDSNRRLLDLNNRFRNTEQNILDRISDKKKDILKLNCDSGESLYIDTSKLYHKGGYISENSKYRLILQGVYTPKISLSNWNGNNSKIMKFFQVKMTNLKIKLRKEI